MYLVDNGKTWGEVILGIVERITQGHRNESFYLLSKPITTISCSYCNSKKKKRKKETASLTSFFSSVYSQNVLRV